MLNENASLIGQQLGIYQVQANLGKGGMAQVYKAYHPRLRREVAIKVILAEIADSAGFQERFEREAQMIASLEHPNIVSVYDFGEEGNLTYLVMQYVGGGTLRDQLRGKRPLEPQLAAHYARQMALALHHAHQRGIVHRDVKPQNMLVSSTDSRHLLLSDFGIAKLYAQPGEDAVYTEMPTRNAASSTLTSASQIIGTADYMSPEQASGGEVDARTDVYALGIVLYQMLVGDIPFHSTTLHGLLFQHLYTPPPPVRAHNPQVPEVLAQITARALAKAPAERFPTAEAMARALEQANTHATLLSPWTPGSAPGAASALLPGGTTQWAPPTTDIDRYATISAPQTGTIHERATSVAGLPRPAGTSDITGIPRPRATKKRRLPLSYVLATLVALACLVVVGLRFLPIPGGGNAGSTNTGNSALNSGTAQAFNDLFEDNHLNWLTGSLSPAVSASTPGGGAYTTTISATETAFPYPQAVGLLPDNFTLSATLQQTAGAPDDAYGIAFHFAEDSSGHVSCYALAIAGNGSYALYEYNGGSLTTVATGSYQAGPQAHSLEVKAQGANYAFFIDKQAIHIRSGGLAPAATWSNSDLRSGRLALLFAGPGAGETTAASFKATSVTLTIP